ncbi:Ig-like domain-containing protein [Iodobacter ciconiae]|uniref:Big-1 domain-containing protein n=1 Tax=Iodobacter ciconiae TaxID=2496266 RepID=A0A3S8ZTM5_9NEIS|nr:Ig-like domain-containing protein [Iodobacter ciconiae]AZN36781.1 hypothetical protein EJO50_09975 [Iodobacter ciconiae]
MKQINFKSKTTRKIAGGLLLLAAVMLTACNGSSGDNAGNSSTSTGQGGSNTSGPVALSVALSPNATVTLGAQTTATATLLDSTGKPIADALVTFSADSKSATLTPSSGKALTNANGQATITLTAASIDASGADTLQVEAAGTAGGKTFTATSVANFSIGNTSIALGAVTLGQSTIDAYATTSVKVKVLINGVAATTPQTVNFSSNCATSKKAKLDPTAITINGEASATYTDDGCTGSDTITVSLTTGNNSVLTPITINPRKASSLKYVSTIPADGVITLKGFGSEARRETAQVVFQLVDSNNNAIQGAAIDLSLDVLVGGVALQSPTSITDKEGKVTATVIAGNQPTPVRVTAISQSNNLRTQSNGLSISTGFPDMDSVSLSADRFNINGLNYDGATSTATVRFADHFNNPIPDGTAINFITDGGRIGDGKTTGQCQSVNSQCVITLNSQNPRPTQGRVHIVAYAIGEESFVDKNNNIIADQTAELVDINGVSSDIGEAFIDINENGKFDTGVDQLIDFNSNGLYDGPDGLYNGILCNSSFSKCATTKKTLHVFNQQTFIFASDRPLVNTLDASSSVIAPALRKVVLQCNQTQQESLWIRESNAENAMPAGTAINYNTVDAGSIQTKSTVIPSSTQKAGLKTGGITVFSPVIAAKKCKDMQEDAVIKGSWGISVAVPDHGGGTALTTDISATLCVYRDNGASALCD